MTRQLVDNERAKDFQGELAEEIEHGHSMMALAAQFAKAGKASLHPSGLTFSFSRLCKLAWTSYADCLCAHHEFQRNWP